MSRGFVYVATGAAYVAEAARSVATLRQAMPAFPVALITDQAPAAAESALFDHVTVRSDAQRLPIDKLLAWEAPFERCIFLDTDTYIAGDLSSVFDVLDTFDLAAAPETLRGWHYQLPGLPAAFPEFNTGLIAFRRTPASAAFFAEWRRQHDELKVTHGFASDQPAFRCAAFRPFARIAVLPSEFHFIAITPNYAMWDVKMLHGRRDPSSTLRQLNTRPGPRVHVPGLGVIHGFNGRSHWLSQGLRLLISGLRTLLRPPGENHASPNRAWLALERERRPASSR